MMKFIQHAQIVEDLDGFWEETDSGDAFMNQAADYILALLSTAQYHAIEEAAQVCDKWATNAGLIAADIRRLKETK